MLKPQRPNANSYQSIDIAAAGKFHAFQLASEFASLSRLRDLYAVHRSLSPPQLVRRELFHNRIDLAAWMHMSRFFRWDIRTSGRQGFSMNGCQGAYCEKRLGSLILGTVQVIKHSRHCMVLDGSCVSKGHVHIIGFNMSFFWKKPSC